MCIVTLEDGTTYNVDTTSEDKARGVVDYKLRQRLDHRKITNAVKIEGTVMVKDSRYYNSGDQFDRKDLHCSYGWDYKWGDRCMSGSY